MKRKTRSKKRGPEPVKPGHTQGDDAVGTQGGGSTFGFVDGEGDEGIARRCRGEFDGAGEAALEVGVRVGGAGGPKERPAREDGPRRGDDQPGDDRRGDKCGDGDWEGDDTRERDAREGGRGGDGEGLPGAKEQRGDAVPTSDAAGEEGCGGCTVDHEGLYECQRREDRSRRPIMRGIRPPPEERQGKYTGKMWTCRSERP